MYLYTHIVTYTHMYTHMYNGITQDLTPQKPSLDGWCRKGKKKTKLSGHGQLTSSLCPPIKLTPQKNKFHHLSESALLRTWPCAPLYAQPPFGHCLGHVRLTFRRDGKSEYQLVVFVAICKTALKLTEKPWRTIWKTAADYINSCLPRNSWLFCQKKIWTAEVPQQRG